MSATNNESVGVATAAGRVAASQAGLERYAVADVPTAGGESGVDDLHVRLDEAEAQIAALTDALQEIWIRAGRQSYASDRLTMFATWVRDKCNRALLSARCHDQW